VWVPTEVPAGARLRVRCLVPAELRPAARRPTTDIGPRFADVTRRRFPSEVAAGAALAVAWITLWVVFVAGVVEPGLSLLP
jgi:hypothetical protein